MCHKSERLLKEWWWTLKIFEELARDNIVNIVNMGFFMVVLIYGVEWFEDLGLYLEE